MDGVEIVHSSKFKVQSSKYRYFSTTVEGKEYCSSDPSEIYGIGGESRITTILNFAFLTLNRLSY